MYRYVYFVGTEESEKSFTEERSRSFGIHEPNDWLFDPRYSCKIHRPTQFLHTIRSNELLRGYVCGASFEWDETGKKDDLKVMESILELLGPSIDLLHLGPSEFDIGFSLMGVSSLDIPYADDPWHDREEKLFIERRIIRENMYSNPSISINKGLPVLGRFPKINLHNLRKTSLLLI